MSLLDHPSPVTSSMLLLDELEDDVDVDGTDGPCCRSCRTAQFYLRDHDDVFVGQ